MSDDGKSVRAAGQKLVELTNKLTLACLEAVAENGGDALALTLQGALGSLSVAAGLVNGGKEKEAPGRDAFLFASLIGAFAYQGAKILKDLDENCSVAGCDFNVNPETVLEAVEAFEKLTGKKARDLFNPHLMAVVDEATKSSVVPFAEFLQKRKDAQKGTDTIQ